MPTTPFAEWAPDQPDLGNYAKTVQNVYPKTAGSYGPMKTLVEVGGALTARCQGGGSFRGSDGTIVTFAGDATKLYKWNSTTLTWDDVTRSVGGAYATPSDGRWVLTQFNDSVYADNGADAPQVWDIGSSSNFAAATGSPPQSKYHATVREFLFRDDPNTDNRTIQWSSQFDSDEWIVGTNQGDTQTFPDGGKITGIVGGQYALIFQEKKVRLGTYIGPDLIFQFDEVSGERGCAVPGSIATFQQTTFFLADDGFFRLDGGQSMTPIGDGKVDQYIWDNISQADAHRCWSLIDPRNKLYYFAWPSSAGNNADTLWVYNWSTNRWAPSTYAVESLFFVYAETGYTLDSLDSIYPNLDTMPISLDSELLMGNPVPKLAAFTPNHKMAFFDGQNLEARLSTVEAQLFDGMQGEIDRAIPLIDGGTPQGKLGYRNRQFDGVTYSNVVTADDQGDIWFRESPARFHRLETIVPAGSVWSHAQGVNFYPAEGGDR